MSESNQFKTVEEYINNQPEQVKNALIELRKYIYDIVPGAVELINYNIPAYSLVEGGKRDQQIMIAGYKEHVGLYPHPATIAKFENELGEYIKGKGSVQFPLDKPLPKELILKMIRYRFELLKK